MSSNKLTFILIGILAVAYVIFSSLFVVNERQQAIVTRFGEITRVHTEPGVYFKVPTDIMESVQIIEDRLLHYDLADIVVQVKGGKFYNVDAFVTYSIDDPTKFRQSVQGSLLVLDRRIDTRFNAALRQVYGLREFSAALSVARAEMMRETRDLMRADTVQLGVNILDVRVLRTDLTDEVSARAYERMQSERLAEAARLRALGQVLAAQLKAIADRQAIEIVATANKDSEITRGQGDGERNRIFAEAYNQDPEFFEFYRSLQAYRHAIGGDDTSLVLSPDTEFFKYFASGGTLLDTPNSVETSVSEPETSANQNSEVTTDTTAPVTAQ